MVRFDSVALSNIFLSIIAMVNIVILLILYRRFGRK